jgi:hypothetical protein
MSGYLYLSRKTDSELAIHLAQMDMTQVKIVGLSSNIFIPYTSHHSPHFSSSSLQSALLLLWILVGLTYLACS